MTPEDLADKGWRMLQHDKRAPRKSAMSSPREKASTAGIVVRPNPAPRSKYPREPPIPPHYFKVVLRISGGFNVSGQRPSTIMEALRVSTGLSKQACGKDMVRLDAVGNLVVVGTEDGDRADSYATLSTLKVGSQTYPMKAYFPTEDQGKGVIRQIPPHHTQQQIQENLSESGMNPDIVGFRRLGASETVLLVFRRQEVPHYVMYGGAWHRCTLFRRRVQACLICYQTGHREDVCPNRGTTKKCRECGTPNPTDGHECTPQCLLCGKSHVTGSRECRKKFETPFTIRQRRRQRRERRAREREEQLPSPPPGGDGRRSRSKERRASSVSFADVGSAGGGGSTAGRRRSTSRGRSGSRSGQSRSRSVPRQQPGGQSNHGGRGQQQRNQQGAQSQVTYQRNWASMVAGRESEVHPEIVTLDTVKSLQQTTKNMQTKITQQDGKIGACESGSFPQPMDSDRHPSTASSAVSVSSPASAPSSVPATTESEESDMDSQGPPNKRKASVIRRNPTPAPIEDADLMQRVEQHVERAVKAAMDAILPAIFERFQQLGNRMTALEQNHNALAAQVAQIAQYIPQLAPAQPEQSLPHPAVVPQAAPVSAAAVLRPSRLELAAHTLPTNQHGCNNQ